MLNDPIIIGQNVKKLRLAFGETQAELGKAIGVTNTAVSNLEQGTRANTFMIAAIARHYGIPTPMLSYEDFVVDDVAQGDTFARRIAGAFGTALRFFDDNMPADSAFGQACAELAAMRDELSRTGTLGFAVERFTRAAGLLVDYAEGEHSPAAMANIAMGYVLLWMAAPDSAAKPVLGRVDAKTYDSGKSPLRLALEANDQGRTGNADPARKAFSEEFDEAVFDLLADVREDPEWADWADFYAALLYLIGFADSGLDDDMQGVVGMHMILTQARLGNRHSVEFLDKYYL